MILSNLPPTILVCLVVLAAAACTDLTRRVIPNSLTFGAAFAGLIYHLSMTSPFQGIAFSAVGCLVGGLLLLFPYGMGWTGAGDVKLMAAIGAWTGPLAIVQVFLGTTMVGGVMALWWFIRHRRTGRTNKDSDRGKSQQGCRMFQGLPYALAIGGGYVLHLAGVIRPWCH